MCHDQDRHCASLGSLLEGPSLQVSSTQRLAGIIEKGPGGLVLKADGGGTWQLENTSAARKLVGSHVEIVGQRCGFNGLVCDEIRVPGEIRREGLKLRLEFLIAAALVAYGLYATAIAVITTLG